MCVGRTKAELIALNMNERFEQSQPSEAMDVE